MAEDEQDEEVPEPDPRPVKRVLDLNTVAAEVHSGAMDFGALMEAAGGELAARQRALRANQLAWHAYRQAEEAYWDTQAFAHFKLHAVATLRMAETTLLKTTLTPEHREHGWSERLVELLASMCAEFHAQVETGTFADPRAGYSLARSSLEDVSPKWPDLDDLSVAVDLASRALDITSHRLGLDNDSSEA